MTLPALSIAPEFEARALSVRQERPVQNGTLRFGLSYRGPILPAKGTREREWRLRVYDHHDYNSIFRGAKAGIIKRVQSTPWEIIATDADRWQQLLMANWETLLSGIISDYLRHDAGAWIEIIAPGDTRLAPTGPMVGLNVLDSLRVYPTGNTLYPAIYYDIHGKMHLMHHTRIIQFVDSPDSEEDLAGYGECALSRCIAAVQRDIIMNRYVEQFLDDKPLPGFLVFGNVSEPAVEAALEKLYSENRRDDGGDWGRTVRLYGLRAEDKPTAEMTPLAKPPEKFDYVTYTNVTVNQIALGMGLDKLDLWELTGQGIGTGTQTEVLAQKSRGKAVGRILKGLERAINQALPDRAEFRWQYKDAQEDTEEAEKAERWASVVQLGVGGGTLTAREGRQILVNQVAAFKDALLDLDGSLRRLPDDDPKPAEEAVQAISDTDTPPASSILDLAAFVGLKAFTGTSRDFARYFTSFVRVGQAQNFSPAIMRATFREELLQAGTAAYEDGLRDGGADPLEADSLLLAERRRKVAGWLALQSPYVNTFVDDVNKGMTPDVARERAALWVNKALRSIYLSGLYDADAGALYQWELGQTEEHCKTCLTLNGQIHSMKEWMASGLLPGASALECQGFNCDCRFRKSNGPKRGRLPGGAQPGPIDRFSSFLARIVGRA